MKSPSLPREQITSSSQTGQPSKKAYQPPMLADYGSLVEYTQASTGSIRADRIGPRPNRFSR
jgi:hypothetical protein